MILPVGYIQICGEVDEELSTFLTLSYFKMTYNIKIARIKDIIFSPPLPPIKGSLKSYCHSRKVEMVMTDKTLTIPFRILEYGQSLCVSEYPTLTKR